MQRVLLFMNASNNYQTNNISMSNFLTISKAYGMHLFKFLGQSDDWNLIFLNFKFLSLIVKPVLQKIVTQEIYYYYYYYY